MKLLTKPLRERLIANYRSNRGGEADHPPVIKLFTPDAQATWLISEFDPEDGLFFGLCDLGMGCPELGYVSLAELETVRGPLGLPVERDRCFEADKPLTAYATEARRAGRIIA